MKKMNQTLAELLTGTLVSGGILFLISFFVTRFDFSFAVVFWFGVLTAMAMCIHMYRSIEKALSFEPSQAEKEMRKSYGFRFLCFLIAAGIVAYFSREDVIAVFLGFICLKLGAFLNPLVHRLMCRHSGGDGQDNQP